MLETPVNSDTAAAQQLYRAIPPVLRERLLLFLLDGHTGNFVMNIRDGKILGAHVEEILSVKSNHGRATI